MRLLKNKGFTLIELLVVITLIGILAIAVLSAINPIEQVNKARDAGRRGDSAQLLKAIERYYASVEEYPWMDSVFTDAIVTVGTEFYSSAEKSGTGLCYGTTLTAKNLTTSGCDDSSGDGILIEAEELKSQFTKRKAFRSDAANEDWLYLLKPVNDPSISVCFIPSSKATRNQWDNLKDINVTGYTAGSEAGIPSGTVDACGAEPTAEEWTSPETACFVCIPEE